MVVGEQAGTVSSRHTPGRLLTLARLSTTFQGPWRCTGGGYSGDQRPAHPVLEGGCTPQLQRWGDEVLLLVYYLGGWDGGRIGVLPGLPHDLR